MADASDAARKKAEELNVDIDAVEGTGANGNVTVADVDAAHAAKTTDPDNPTANESAQDGSASELADQIEDEGKVPAVVNSKVNTATYSCNVGGKFVTFSKNAPEGVTAAQLGKLQKDHKYGDEPYVVEYKPV